MQRPLLLLIILLTALLWCSCHVYLPNKWGINKTKWKDTSEVRTGKWMENNVDTDNGHHILICNYKNGVKEGKALLLLYDDKDSAFAWYDIVHYKHNKKNGYEKDYCRDGNGGWLYVRKLLYRNDSLINSHDYVRF